jgi:hypothetical protein
MIETTDRREREHINRSAFLDALAEELGEQERKLKQREARLPLIRNARTRASEAAEIDVERRRLRESKATLKAVVARAKAR